ncbi:MAG: NusG domain II-containing protein [Clostridia bacterium]|nr:NusG domain II-containing protein [Clostridia bacterium]
MSKNEAKTSAACAKSRARNDIIFIAVLLAAVCAVGLLYFFVRAEGDTVAVTVNGKLFAEYPLSEDRTVEIRMGDNLNILVIKDGEAYVSEASCPDGICAAHKPISRDGETIVCLPNKVVVSISIKSGAEEPDIIV